MRLRIGATLLTAVSALLLASPAAAVIVPIDYTISANGITFGNMILDYDGSAYSLDSLAVTLDKSAIVTSDVTLSPVAGTNDYCLYTLSACSVVPQQNSLYVIFDPSLTSQTSTLFGYSVKDQADQSAPVTIARAAVPEPATWATMLLGFGLIGASMQWTRRRAFRAAT